MSVVGCIWPASGRGPNEMRLYVDAADRLIVASRPVERTAGAHRQALWSAPAGAVMGTNGRTDRRPAAATVLVGQDSPAQLASDHSGRVHGAGILTTIRSVDGTSRRRGPLRGRSARHVEAPDAGTVGSLLALSGGPRWVPRSTSDTGLWLDGNTPGEATGRPVSSVVARPRPVRAPDGNANSSRSAGAKRARTEQSSRCRRG